MKCVCRKKCQARIKTGKIKYFYLGDIEEFDEVPPNFEPVQGEAKDATPIDFDTAGEQELMEAEYDLDSLKDYITNNYDMKAGNRGKTKTVALLLDCRFRQVSPADLNPVGNEPPKDDDPLGEVL